MCLAVPGKLISSTGDGLERTGSADFGGVLREVSLAFVPEAALGDYVIVHAGVAIAVLDEDAAAETLEALAAAGVAE